MLNEEQRAALAQDGFLVMPSALSGAELDAARDALDRAVAAQGVRDGRLDPNDANIRVYNLPALDPVFIDLSRHEQALGATRDLLGPGVLLSNFTANIALPGSGSMNIHSDQALVVPGPWLAPWTANIIWCLDDVHDANGATRYLPGSHRFTSKEEVPADALERSIAFEAPAGSFILMEGRMWHTSGANRTADERRRMMFAYYSCDFIRQQANWAFTLPPEIIEGMDEATRKLFGLEEAGNVRIGGQLTRREVEAV